MASPPVQHRPAPTAPANQPDAPHVRVIHMMARSGGTIIAKCLGVMPSVVMLSEVHPAVATLMHQPRNKRNQHALGVLWSFDPLRQADQWFGLLTREDKDRIRAARKPLSFEASVAMIHRRATEHGESLVLRDWSHLDFLGEPFTPSPPMKFSIVSTLAPTFRLSRAVTVRHPIDQWLSMRNLPMLREEIPLDAYLRGCRRFAEEAVPLGFTRFEDFARDPQTHARALCDRLALGFDPSFEKRWSSYKTITGDVAGSRAQSSITLPPRREVDAELLGRFAANPDYRATLDLLGYSHP